MVISAGRTSALAVKPPASSERDKKKTAALCGVFFFMGIISFTQLNMAVIR